MRTLDSNVRGLEIVLAAPAATGELPFVLSYLDVDQATGRGLAEQTFAGTTSGTAAAAMLPAPPAGNARQTQTFVVHNDDTAAATVTVQLNDGGATTPLDTFTLQPGDHYHYVIGRAPRVTSSTGVSSVGIVSVSNADGSLTVSPTTGAVVASLNTAHANAWTATQTIQASADGNKDLVLQGHSGTQSADLMEWTFFFGGSHTLAGGISSRGFIGVSGNITAAPTFTYPFNALGDCDGAARGPFYARNVNNPSIGTALTLDCSGDTGGGKVYSFISTGSSAAAGAGCFSVFDGTGGYYPFTVLSSGHLNVARTFFTDIGQVGIVTSGASVKGLVVRGVASQSGQLVQLQGQSSTTAGREQVDIDTAWADSTDATRKARGLWRVWDSAARECFRTESSGSAALMGFFGATAAAQQSGDVATGLVNLGLFSSATTGTGKAAVSLYDRYADANNTTTGETVLYSDGLGAGKLAANGDKVTAEYGGTWGDVTANSRVRVYFGPNGSSADTLLFDTGAVAVGAVAPVFGPLSWAARVLVTRESSSAVRCTVWFSSDATALTAAAVFSKVSGLTLANQQYVTVTGQASGTGAGSNQITASQGMGSYAPAA